jgi:CRISPR-associated protein Cst2
MKKATALTITYLTPVSFASLNGSDKEADNISSIKKITVGTEEIPYVSSQAIRRALRNQLAVLGRPLSEGVTSSIAKGAATTQQQPGTFIDDDLFGFMSTEEANKETKEKGKSTRRTSPVRVSPLIALTPYRGDLDFGTNYMSVESGGNPNIFETEIHSGLYRGTILIELDRIGCGDGFKEDLDTAEKAARVKDLLRSLKNLWSSGRQSRFLADISPKFVAAAMTTTKNPIFLESVRCTATTIDAGLLEDTLKDYKDEIVESVIGLRSKLFEGEVPDAVSIGEAFELMMTWIDKHYTT